jgi:hypothetical protein
MGEIQGGAEKTERDGGRGAEELPAPTLLGTDRGADTGRPTERSTERDTDIERDIETQRHKVTGRDLDSDALSRLKAWSALVALDIAKEEYSRAHDVTVPVSAEAAIARQTEEETAGERGPKAGIEVVTAADIETEMGAAEMEASTRGVEMRVHQEPGEKVAAAEEEEDTNSHGNVLEEREERTAWREEEAEEDNESILKRDVLEERLGAAEAAAAAAASQVEARVLNAHLLEEREVEREAAAVAQEAQAFINSVYQGETPLGAQNPLCAESGAEAEVVARAGGLVHAYLPCLWPLLDLVEAEYVDEDDLSWKLLSLFDILCGSCSRLTAEWCGCCFALRLD